MHSPAYGVQKSDASISARRKGTEISGTRERLRNYNSSEWKTSAQCTIAVNKANQVLGMIRRNTKWTNQEVIVRLYRALVRPRIEYCVQAWSHFRPKVSAPRHWALRTEVPVQGKRYRPSAGEWTKWACSPNLEKDKLQKVQRRATKIEGFGNLSYNERLRRTRLTTLEERRTRGDLIETFKMVKGINKVDYTKFFSMSENN